MNEDDSRLSSCQTPILVTIGIALVVLAAFLLAQIDNSQRRSALPPRQLPIIDQDATIVAHDPDIIYLPAEGQPQATLDQTAPEITPTQESVPVTTEADFLVPTCKSIPDDWSEYIVQPGDSLSTLAVQFGVSKKTIAQANCLAFDQIIQGQVIYLPLDLFEKYDGVNCGAPNGWIQHVIHPHDNLLKLAKEYNISIFEIMKANCLESTNLAPGRKLFLPPTKPFHP
jgi:LysM repeat protein